MKRLLLVAMFLWSVAYGQVCADEDTVRSNAASLITATTARINGTVAHFTSAPTSLQLRYVRVGQTDTATASSAPTTALRNLTGLQPNTQYVYYYKTICGSGTRSQTIGAYTFTTLANTIFYAPERPTIFNHVKVDSSMIIPAGDTVVGREPSTGAQIRYKTSNNTFYGYYPSCTCWRPLAIDSAGIIALLDGKVDSVTVSGDSLFYWKVGVSYGYILPALNDVWRNTGNTGIDTSVNWLGTNDANDLVIKTNNTRKFTINGNGAFGIGNPADYGTSLYRLKSSGSAGPPVWGTNTISELTGATGTNSIDNSGYGQSWSWNGLASGNGLILSINNTTAVSGQTVVSISTSGANASANRTTYGVAITNNRTGTNNGNNSLYSAASGGSAYNRAGWFTASGASGNNYGGYFSATGGTNNYSLFAGEGDVALNQVSGSTYIGTPGSVSGVVHIAGSTSGLITIQPQGAAGTYNFNLPTTAGSSGDVLTSAGGGGSAMTWTTPVTASSTTTLTNKRWTARVGSTTSSATPTINTDNVDIYKLTAQAAAITSFTSNLSGTPVDGDILEIQITDNGTARAITWGASFVSTTVTLPTTTTISTTLTVVFQYYTTSSYGNNKWHCVNYY